MSVFRANVTFVCIGVYLAGCVAVGIWAMRRTKSSSDFFMAGRKLGVLVTGCAVFSSTMSGFGFVGGPGLVYRMGMSSIWIVVSAAVGYCLSFVLLSKRLRLISELRDTISLPDAIALRYRSETSRFLAAIAILLGVVGYLATQIKAMSTVLVELVKNHPELDEISLGAAVFISCAVLVFYCATGGIIAGVYTDTFQGAFMLVAALLVFGAALGAVEGGMTGVSETLFRDDPESVSPWGTLGIFGCLTWFFVFAVGGAGQPHLVTKMMMTRDVEDATRILPLSLLGYTVAALLWVGVGFAMRAIVLEDPSRALGQADDAAPYFLANYTDPLLAGIVFAGLFAAIMSTADAFLNIGAAALVHDIPRALRRRSLENELLWARVATVAIVVVSALFALYSGEFVAHLGASAWGTFAAALVPTVAIGLNWKRGTALAANVAMGSSLLVNLSARLTGYHFPHGMHEGAIALLLSLTLFFGISLAQRPMELEPDIDAIMDL